MLPLLKALHQIKNRKLTRDLTGIILLMVNYDI